MSFSVPVTAVELLFRGNEGREEPFINKYWGPLLGATIGFGIACALNFGSRRPILSGVQKYPILMGLGGATTTYFDNRRREYNAERDAVYRHYVTLHPDDFREEAPIKIGDLLEPWTPIR